MSNVRVDDRVWKQIMRHASMQSSQAKESHVKVGILGSAATKSQAEGISIIELAAIHEFGSPAAGIPERSFIRRTLKERESEIAKITAVLAKKFIRGELTLERALNQLGAQVAAMIKNTVTAGEHIPPPLKPATVRRKGSDRPLVDTGRMIAAVTWKVWMGRERDARGRFA